MSAERAQEYGIIDTVLSARGDAAQADDNAG